VRLHVQRPFIAFMPLANRKGPSMIGTQDPARGTREDEQREMEKFSDGYASVPFVPKGNSISVAGTLIVFISRDLVRIRDIE